MSSIAGLGPFLAYLTVSLGMIAVYLAVYLQATGHRELALIVQVAVYLATRLLLPDVSRRIEDGETASATLLAATSLAGGIVDAAAMTY